MLCVFLEKFQSDLVEKRANLSKLLTDLLEQQKIRREQLISSLKNLEDDFENVNQDFWLRQYQQLLDRYVCCLILN